MKRLIRNVCELVSLWAVLGVILFLFAWLVLPQMLGAPDDLIPTAASVPARSV